MRALLGAALAALVLWLFWPGPKRQEKPPAASPGVKIVRPAPAASAWSPASRAPTGRRLREEYEAYKAGSVYPDWSQPLTADQDFRLRWNDAITHELPVDDAGRIVLRFDADRARAFAGQAYTSWIEAFEVRSRRPLPVRIDKASVVVTGGAAAGEAFALGYRDDGREGDLVAGDLRYTNRFVPSEHVELARVGTARVEAYVNVQGHVRRFVRDFVWAPRPVLEVIATRDTLRDGSLALDVDALVHEAGVYTLYANLFATGGKTPLAAARRDVPLVAGRQQVALVFFGKVLADAQADGPYLVRDLHGLKREQDGELGVWFEHAGAHVTRAYAADDFSNAEWDGEERRARLARFERALAELSE